MENSSQLADDIVLPEELKSEFTQQPSEELRDSSYALEPPHSNATGTNNNGNLFFVMKEGLSQIYLLLICLFFLVISDCSSDKGVFRYPPPPTQPSVLSPNTYKRCSKCEQKILKDKLLEIQGLPYCRLCDKTEKIKKHPRWSLPRYQKMCGKDARNFQQEVQAYRGRQHSSSQSAPIR